MSADEQRRALDYVRRVRERFIAEPKRYERFLTIMKDFKSQRCGAFKNRIATSSSRAHVAGDRARARSRVANDALTFLLRVFAVRVAGLTRARSRRACARRYPRTTTWSLDSTSSCPRYAR
jgi:hypothetical protein